MLLRTGLGSNSSTGSPKQAPMGTRPTLTVAVSNLLGHVRDGLGPDPNKGKFLTVIGLPAGQLEELLGEGNVLPRKFCPKKAESCGLVMPFLYWSRLLCCPEPHL